jgi:hypothetical protein
LILSIWIYGGLYLLLHQFLHIFVIFLKQKIPKIHISINLFVNLFICSSSYSSIVFISSLYNRNNTDNLFGWYPNYYIEMTS